MKKKFLRFSLLSAFAILFGGAALGALMDDTTIYSWIGGASDIAEEGGTAVGSADGLVGARNAGNNTIKLDGKADFSTNTITVTLEKELKAGDKILVTAYRNKNDVNKQSGFKAKFDKGGEVASETGLEFVNIDSSAASEGDSNRGTEPNTCEFVVPDAAAGSTTITMTRSHQGTNLFITQLVITSSADGQESGGDPEPGKEAEDVTATWDFHNADGNYYAAGSANIEGTTGSLEATASDGSTIALEVDATNNGKLYSRGNGDAQFNTGTIIRVPVKNAGDEVTVVSYPNYHNYTIAGVAAENDSETYTAVAADAAAGYVEIVATATSYLYSIKVLQKAQSGDEEPQEAEAVFASWDYGNEGVMNETMALSGTTTAGEVNSVEGTLKMTVEANGATFRNNGNNIQVRTGAVFKIPVRSAGDEVFVSGYPSYSYYTIGDDQTELTGDNTYTAKTADANKGYVAVTSTNNNNYYYKLSVNQKAITGEANMVEKALYITDFTEWPTIDRKNATNATNTVTTLYSQEQLTFTLTGIGVDPAGNNAKFAQYTGYMISAKDSEYTAGDVVGTTSPLNNITKVVFTQAATGGNRGWKISVKGDGDEDWVELHNQSIGTQSGETITLNVNRKNAQLKFENFAVAQNAYMVDLKIYGEVDLSNAPLLGSFKFDGTTYTGEQFDMTGTGNYEAMFELFSTQQLPGINNPITEVTPDNGEVGEITYEEADLQTVVTIPITAKGQTVNYVATFIYKPMMTMTYYDQNGEEIGTQQIEKDTQIGEFQYNIDDVASTRDGYKARGWFKQNYQGEKWLETSTVSEDISLYAYETEIEEASLSRKYEFDLTDPYFYAEDHEAFNPEGSGKYYNNHGWVFSNGDKIDLLVGPKANIVIGLCAYSKEGATIEASNGASINAKSETDGATDAIEYEGEGGTLTLTINSTGAVYIHSIKIFNTSETNYDKQGQWIVVKPGDTSSFLDALDAANGSAGDERVYIFLPDGTYDLGTAVLTEITRTNISIIGQTREGVIIKNAPPTSMEGLGKADLLLNTSTGLYLEDLTLQNGLDYYNSGSAGRAPTLHDKGTKTINKNVRHLSYQDTYYSHQTGGLYYFEGGELHGTVDYLCGNGKVYFNEVDLVNEQYSNATMTANSELYVFNNCTVKAGDATAFNFGRAWSDNPVCIWLNTKLEEPDKLIQTRWNLSGINCDYSIAGEYGTTDAEGNNITPDDNIVTFTKANTMLNTILTEEQAAQYTIEYVLGDWATEAQEACVQLEPPVATLSEGTITWEAVDGASAYAIFKNEIFVGLTTETSFTLEEEEEPASAPALEESEPDIYTLRVANGHGGLGDPMVVIDNSTGIRQPSTLNTQHPSPIFDLNGRRVQNMGKGVYIVGGKKVVVK